MALSVPRLKEKIIDVMEEIRKEETDPDASMEAFAQALAQAIVEEIKELTITATAPNGPVTIVKLE